MLLVAITNEVVPPKDNLVLFTRYKLLYSNRRSKHPTL